ncbi:MAG: sporulation protein YhbH [Dehalococcoidia bacterium]|nr:sporulation protein YhbH [Dehalococcoidia bacterium]
MPAYFSIGQSDWSLHRKGLADQQRHKEKVWEAIKGNLADIVGDESIIMADDKTIIRAPIRSLQEYKLRFDHSRGRQAGQGDGSSKQGDVIGETQKQGDGQKGHAGEQPGVDFYEAEITLEELSKMLFEDLGLPYLQEKKRTETTSGGIRFTDVRRTGILANLDKRRTVKEAIKRRALAHGEAKFKDIKLEDLRFKTWEVQKSYQSSAVVIAMMDVSGSMGEFEKYVARSFYFWLVRFLRTRYGNVEIVFIAHHTEAKEVTEEEFFHRGESGGTKVSSAYQLALDVIKDRYPPDQWNIYPFHFSDGENIPWDNDACLGLVTRLLEVCNLMGYGEIRSSGRGDIGSLLSSFQAISDKRFVRAVIADKNDVYPALKSFLTESEAVAA